MTTRRYGGVIHHIWGKYGDGLMAAFCFLLSLALYLRTLAPSVAHLFDDTLELPLVVDRLAIAHPTGYPFYTLLGKLFTLGAGQNVAWRLNLLSAVAGALTVALVYLLIRQLIRRRWPALLGAFALAVSPVFWSLSVVAEVYTLNTCFIAALLWLALRWARRPLLPVSPFSLLLVRPPQPGGDPPPEPERIEPAPISSTVMKAGPGALLRQGLDGVGRLLRAARRVGQRAHALYRRFLPAVPPSRRLRPHPLLLALAALLGLGLTHHRTVILLAPALIVFIALVERRVLSRAALLGPERTSRPRWLQLAGRPIVLLAACFLFPLLFYLYLPIRGQVGSLDGSYVNTWSGFWRWVTAGDYNVFFGSNPLARHLDAAFYLQLFWQQFGPVGLALAVVGLAGMARQPKALSLIGLAFVSYLAFAVLYRAPDVEVFFLPAFLVTAVWIGVGLNHAVDLFRPRGPSLATRRLLAACGLVLVVAAAVQGLAVAIRSAPDVDLSRHWTVHDYGLYQLAQPLPAGSTVVGLLGEVTLLRYFQEVVGLRPDLETVAADAEPARREAIEAALAAGGAVYTTRSLPGLADDYALGSVTGLIDVDGELETLTRVGDPVYGSPSPPWPTNLEPVPGLRLLGYGLEEHRGHWQAWARLKLWWQAPQGLQGPLKVSARLVDSAGHVVAAVDAEPVAGAYPTTAWRPGEIVADAYEIPLPAGLPPADYSPMVIVYDPVTAAERGRVELPALHLEGNPARPPRRALEAGLARTVYARFGSLELLGYTPPDPQVTYRPGETVPLVLLWQAAGQAGGEWRLAFWLNEEGDHVLGDEPLGGPYEVGRWQTGQAVRQWPVLALPAGLLPGTYRLRMRVLRDGQPVPWGRGFIPLGSDLDLGAVQVDR